MTNARDVFEWRRYGHWSTSAAKARFAAFLLWNLRDTSWTSEMAEQCGHQSDDAELAVLEAFRRESSVALELVIKAVIADKLVAKRADPALEGGGGFNTPFGVPQSVPPTGF